MPLNKLNTEINQFEIENKLRRALNVCLFLAICAKPKKEEPAVVMEEQKLAEMPAKTQKRPPGP